MRLRYGPLEQAGPFLLAVTIDGSHVAGSPFLLHCRPGPPVGEHSSFDETRVVVRAGEVARLLITTRDHYRNRCSEGGSRVSVHDASPEHDADRLNATPSLKKPPDERVHYHEMMLAAGEAVEVIDRGEGSYEARVLLHRAGKRRFLGCVHGVPFDAGAVELLVQPAALHAPSCIPHGDALECFVVAGIPAYLNIKARDMHSNHCGVGGRDWAAGLEVLAPDASVWHTAAPNPLVSDDPSAPAGHYQVKVVAPHCGPLRLTLRPLVHGVPSSDALTIGLLACPSPCDPLRAFHVSGEALRVAVAGEPAQLVVRPRAFGDARSLAARTFGGLRAWIALPGGNVDGGARLQPLRVSRRHAHAATPLHGGFSSGGVDEWEATYDAEVAAEGGASGPSPTACGAGGVPAEESLSAGGFPDGKRRVASWHGANGGWTLVCTEDDLYDIEEWPLHFTSFHATRAAAVHIELFGVPIGGAPFPCTVIPAATNAPKSVVTGLVQSVRAGEPLRFSLQARDRFGNVRWGGGDLVRLMLLRDSTPGGSLGGAAPTKAAQRWGGIVRAGLWTPATSMPAGSEVAAGAEGSVDSRDTADASAAAAAAAEAAEASWGTAYDITAMGAADDVEHAAGASGASPGRRSTGAQAAAAELAAADNSLELLQMRGGSSAGCDVIDHADGRYALTVLATLSGKYTVHTFINDRPAMAPWPYIIRPGPPDAATSELSVGATKGTIGRWVPLHVLARDVYGNVADPASLGAPAGVGEGLSTDGGIEIHVVGGEGRAMPIQPLGEGKFESSVVAPVACLLRVAVTIGGVHLHGSPFELQVNAGRSAAAQSYAEGSGWQRRVVVGDKVSFTIHAYDQQGNPQNRPTDTFMCTLTPRARGNHATQLRTAYLGGGNTLVEYTVDQPGSYVLSVTLKGYHVRESPFNITAGSGFFSDHLAQHKEPPSSPNNLEASGTIAQQHARSLTAIERQNASEARLAVERASTAPTDSDGPVFPHAPLRSSFGSARDGSAAAAARDADRVAEQIRAVRRQAVERGLLLGAEPPLRPPVSPRQAFEASVAAAADDRAHATADSELPPRALWERRRAETAAAAAATEAARVGGSSRGGSSLETRATPPPTGLLRSPESRAREARARGRRVGWDQA